MNKTIKSFIRARVDYFLWFLFFLWPALDALESLFFRWLTFLFYQRLDTKRSEKNILMHGLLIEKSSNWFIGHLIFCTAIHRYRVTTSKAKRTWLCFGFMVELGKRGDVGVGGSFVCKSSVDGKVWLMELPWLYILIIEGEENSLGSSKRTIEDWCKCKSF